MGNGNQRHNHVDAASLGLAIVRVEAVKELDQREVFRCLLRFHTPDMP
jgi:hypothetical protein